MVLLCSSGQQAAAPTGQFRRYYNASEALKVRAPPSYGGGSAFDPHRWLSSKGCAQVCRLDLQSGPDRFDTDTLHACVHRFR